MKNGGVKIVMAGGGTGGHLFPGLALALAWRRYDPNVTITFLGTPRGLEDKVLPPLKFPFVPLKIPTLMDKRGLGRVGALLRLPAALVESWIWLAANRPRLVVGLGGYTAGPALVAAWFLKIPTVLLEQNARPGQTNLWAGRWAKRIFTWSSAAGNFFGADKVRPVGVPVRESIRLIEPKLGRPNRRLTLLVLGGSQGARSINELILESIPTLSDCPGLKIIHQSGPWFGQELREAYARFGLEAEVIPFIEDMARAYGEADLVVVRAGAGTLAEIAAVGLPSILIPYPFAARGHQQANAADFERAGASWVREQSALTGTALGEEVVGLLKDPARREAMGRAARSLDRPNAAQEILNECLEIIWS